jgi:acid phosphatase type 7
LASRLPRNRLAPVVKATSWSCAQWSARVGGSRVKLACAITLVVGSGLVFAVGSQAKTSHRSRKCGRGYVRRSIRVPERKHGRIVRRHGEIVYTRVQRCVKPATHTPAVPFPPVIGPTTAAGQPSPFAPIVGAASAPANTALPAVSGSATPGSTLSATPGTWTNTPTGYGYQWERCDAGGGSCQNLTGATTSSYLIDNGDVGSTVRVSVTATNASGSGSATSAATGPVTSPSDPVVVAVGDIACPGGDLSHACRQLATETLASRQNPSAVLVLGDNQYDSGLYGEYTGAGAYGATWGTFNSIVHPIPGNHEYAASSSATGYFQYFGANGVVTNSPGGYYSFNLGSWHIVALNSNCSDVGCVDSVAGAASTAQLSWLRSDLAANRSACVLAMWHHPRFSGGDVGNSPGVAPFWNALYPRADLVLNGHDHIYERYAQLNPSGSADPSGIREFVIGTGGENLGNYVPGNVTTPPGAPTVDDPSDFGVLALTLHATSYSWKFVSTGGRTVDSGTTVCHGSGSAPGGIAAARDLGSTRAARLREPLLSFDARPLAASLKTVSSSGLPVAVRCSRACDVAVTAWLGRGRHLRQIASFYETESQIPRAFSQIVLRLPARSLTGVRAAALVLRFAALDAAGHRRVVTRRVTLR